MQTALWELQKSLYSALSNDTELSSMITGIYDQVKKDALYPYITLGEPTVTPNDTKTSYGENIVWVIHTWDGINPDDDVDSVGKKQSYEILNLILKNIKSLSIGGGFSIARYTREQLQVITDIDGITRHGILRVRFIIGGD